MMTTNNEKEQRLIELRQTLNDLYLEVESFDENTEVEVIQYIELRISETMDEIARLRAEINTL